MRERPILFSTPMVQAILAGRKTVTRRTVKPQPPEDDAPLATGWFHPETADGGPGPHTFGVYGVDWHVRCPYGAPNDWLWVRETWSARTARGFWAASARDVGSLDVKIYRASWPTPSRPAPPHWLSPIYMPRWASRITLEVVSVRVERLQEITEEDARAEGVRPSDAAVVFQNDASGRPHQRSDMGMTHLGAFAVLWDQINGKRAPWASNPWVWRVEFRRVT